MDRTERSERALAEHRANAERYDRSTIMGHDRWQAALKARLSGLSWEEAHRIAAHLQEGFSTGEDVETAIEYSKAVPPSRGNRGRNPR